MIYYRNNKAMEIPLILFLYNDAYINCLFDTLYSDI